MVQLATEDPHVICECGCGELYPLEEMVLRRTDYEEKPFEWLSLGCHEQIYQGNDTHIMWEGREVFYPHIPDEDSSLRILVRQILKQINPLLKLF